MEAILLTQAPHAAGAGPTCWSARTFRADGWAEVESAIRTPGARCTSIPIVQCLTGMVWRALAILAEAGTTHRADGLPASIARSSPAPASAAGPGIRSRSCPSAWSGPSEPQGGTHASPRWHVRRGHWRQLADGRRVFVRACEVGDPERGGVMQGLHRRETARHDRLHPVAGAGRGHPRDQGLVREPHRRAAGVPDVRLCRFRKEHGAALRPRRARPRSPHQGERDGGCVPGVVTATFTGKAAYVLREQGHAGAHHPQPDLQRARGDRGGGRGRGEEGRARRRAASAP